MAMLALTLGACASGPMEKLDESTANAYRARPIEVGDPLNLSGRPLREVDEKFWSSDSITVGELLSGGPAIDIPAAFQSEVVAAMREAGWHVAVRPMPPVKPKEGEEYDPAAFDGLTLELAITTWDTSSVVADGTLKVGAMLMLLQPATKGPKMSSRGKPFREPVSRTEYQREVKLLQPVTVPGGESAVVGEARVIEGRYRQIVAMLARELLREAGMTPATK